MSDLPSREDVQGEWVDDLPTYLQHVLLPLALAWQSGQLVDRETIDYEEMAKAIYKDYEDCSDSYVEQVWTWESIPDTDRAGLEARDAFRQTVEEFTSTAHHAFAAAIGDIGE